MSEAQSLVLEKSTIDRSNFHVPDAVRRFFSIAGEHAPELTARWAARRFLAIRRRPVPTRERQWLAGGRRSDPVVAGRRLAVWTFGDGPPVLLVHGWEGRGSQLGAFVAPLVAHGLKVVTFDAPGHGASRGTRSSLPEMAEAVGGLVARLGGVYGLVAHSAGAAASTVALGAGAEVSRTIYIAPPADLGRFAGLMAHHLGLPPSIPRRMQEILEERFGVRWERLRGPAIAPELTVPLLVFHDRADSEVPWEDGHELVSSWPGAELASTHGLGHRRILRDRRVIARAVEFLTRPAGLKRSIGRELDFAAERLAAALVG